MENEQFELIRKWAYDRGLYTSGKANMQFVKLMEEVGELARALQGKDGEDALIDAIGDCVVVLTNLAYLNGMNIEDCIAHAYNQIKNRTGKMQGGTFVKD